MTLTLENTIESGDIIQQHNPVSQAQEPFKEKAFCIVGDEMKAKMETLGIDEEDVRNYSSEENDGGNILELISRYFPKLLALKEQLFEIIKEGNGKDSILHISTGDKNEKVDLNVETCRIKLLELLSGHTEELKILFSNYKNDGVKVITSCYERHCLFDLFRAIRAGIEKYQFSWDLLIEFFTKIPREVYTSISDQKSSLRSINLLLETYLILSDNIKEKTLLDDLIKLSLASGKENVGRFLAMLEYMNDENKKFMANNYDIMVRLGIIAGKNNISFFSSPNIIGKTVGFIKKNDKLEDSIISGLEKLGPDFIYVLDSSSGFIQEVLKRFPERLVEFCENLKKLADYSKNNEIFYRKSLDFIIQFIVNHPDNWNYLLKIGDIFGKNIPGIFSIGKGFINELFKYFPDNYEEILLEVRDVGEHIHGGNEGYFLTYGLKFLAQFLEEGKEKFMEAMDRLRNFNDEKLKQNNNTGGVFFEDGLDFVSKYIIYSPEIKNEKRGEICEKIIKIINKHYSNQTDNSTNNFFKSYMLGMNQYIGYQIIDQDITLLDELLNFLEKVGGSKDALRVISSLKDLSNVSMTHFRKGLGVNKFSKYDRKNTISYTLAYLLKHKKSKIIPFIKNLNLIKDLNLGININQVLLGGVSLEYKSNEELQELFAGEKAEDTQIWKYFVKIGGQNTEDIKRWILQIKQSKKIDKTKAMQYLLKIQNVFADLILEYFEDIIHKKIHLKFRREFKLSKDFDDTLINENLFEFYKMYSSTEINKSQAFELIQKYLNGEVYNGNGNISQKYPYNRQENKDFLSETLKDKTSIWLSRNEKVYNIEETENGEEKVDNIPERIANHLKVANDKLELLEVKNRGGKIREFKDYIKLLKFFELLKKDKEKYDTNIFSDLEFQVNAIKDLLKNKNTKKVSKIKIYHELEPLKIAMMGNWVDGSCLSFYSSVGNYWSAITNALEVNKGVFFIEDEHENVIARVLVGIDKNGNFDLHPIYYKGNLSLNLSKYFMSYIYGLSNKIGNSCEGNRNVELLFCDNWYSGD